MREKRSWKKKQWDLSLTRMLLFLHYWPIRTNVGLDTPVNPPSHWITVPSPSLEPPPAPMLTPTCTYLLVQLQHVIMDSNHVDDNYRLLAKTRGKKERGGRRVRGRVKERERVCVCVWVCKRERECVCVVCECLCVWKRERVCVCFLWVSLCMKERERERVCVFIFFAFVVLC